MGRVDFMTALISQLNINGSDKKVRQGLWQARKCAREKIFLFRPSIFHDNATNFDICP